MHTPRYQDVVWVGGNHYLLLISISDILIGTLHCYQHLDPGAALAVPVFICANDIAQWIDYICRYTGGWETDAEARVRIGRVAKWLKSKTFREKV